MPRKAAIPKPPEFDPDEGRVVEVIEAKAGPPPDREPDITRVGKDGKTYDGYFYDERPSGEESPPVQPKALARVETDHVITGLGMLAKMSDAEFDAKLEMLRKGRERVAEIQKTLMVEGVDYGKVKGIDRPFLHLPGAESLEKFYGLMAEQKVTRIDGTFDPAVGWLSPPYAYRTDTLVHLGDIDGPIVAMTSGSCNVWESRYRYRNAKATCPKCGREGLIRGKPDGKLKGKWWCPGREGGCNNTFEPNQTKEDGSLLVEPPGKVENTDFYDLDETIIQISQKRSYVAAIRRATGTSGLFTIDDDSPSVQQQAAEAGETDAAAPVIEAAAPIGVPIEPGARTSVATALQHQRLKVLAMEKSLNGAKIADILHNLFGLEVEPTGAAASAAARELSADQMGQLIHAIETGEMPTPTAASVEADDPVAYATYPDDIGAK